MLEVLNRIIENMDHGGMNDGQVDIEVFIDIDDDSDRFTRAKFLRVEIGNFEGRTQIHASPFASVSDVTNEEITTRRSITPL